MGKRVAIVQSSYIPWKGYFDLIGAVDEFLFFDDVQFTRRDWRSRNQIKTPDGLLWLTIPVKVKGNYYQAVKDMEIADARWAEHHWKSIRHNYSRAVSFPEVEPFLAGLYREAAALSRLSEINRLFTERICRLLGIETKLSWSMDYKSAPGQTERLVSLCRQTGAEEYVSGPRARAYIREELFEAAGIRLTYFDYANYSEYRQLDPPFVHTVSIVDLLLNDGHRAWRFLKSTADRRVGPGAAAS